MKKIKYIAILQLIGGVTLASVSVATSCGASQQTLTYLGDLILNRSLGHLENQNPDIVLQTVVSLNQNSKLKIGEMRIISTNLGSLQDGEQEIFAFISCKEGSKVYEAEAVSVTYSITYHIPTPLNITNTDLGLLKSDYSDDAILAAAAAANPSTDFSELIVSDKDISNPTHATAVIKPDSYSLMYTGFADINFSLCVELSSYLMVTNLGPIPTYYTTNDLQQRINSVNSTEVN